MATIRLMLDPPATRTIPIGEKLWCFPGKKWIPGLPEEVADRCRATNKAEGREIFEILPAHIQVELVAPVVKQETKEPKAKAAPKLRKIPVKIK